MGSKLRKLRAKAGVTGRAHQKRLRESARRKERARLSFQDGNVIVGVNSKGGQLHSAGELQAKLESSKAKSEMDRLLADMARHARESSEARQAGHIERELAEQIAAAGAGWPDSGPFHVADYISPPGLGPTDVCRVCGKERPTRLLVVGDDVTQQSAAAVLAAALNEHEASRDGGGRAVFLAEGERVTATADASGISAAYAIASAPDEFVSPPREPGMRIPKRRATPLQAIALLAMMGGLAAPPRRDR